MELSLFEREGVKKSEIKKIRRDNAIPAVIYSAGEKNRNIYVKNDEFEAILRQIPEGQLSTQVFTLKQSGKKTKAIIKDIQYHRTSYAVLHIDFEGVSDKPINVNIPIVCKGANECVGIKLGGILRKVIHFVKVRCKPEHIPHYFEVDVSTLNIMGSKKLSDLVVPENVQLLAKNMGEVVVVIAKVAAAAP